MNSYKIPGTVILADRDHWKSLLPLTFTRPVSEIKIGLKTIHEKWMDFSENEPVKLSVDFLGLDKPDSLGRDIYVIHSGLLPDESTIREILTLQTGQSIFMGDILLASRIENTSDSEGVESSIHQCTRKMAEPGLNPRIISRPWHILQYLKQEIEFDFNRLTAGKQSAKLSETNRVIGKHPVFVEEGATAECAIFNTNSGPVYLGKGSEVMEGSMIRGPVLLGEGSTINMGAKIYGPTAIGQKCKVGGEVKGSQFFGNANKGHDGFLGDSVLGEWCNLGADTNVSNLKNNYLPVRVWSYVEEKFIDTGLQFCGLIMGDHSKSGINTMFNTGTVVGAYANIFGEGYPRTFIPSFSWGGASGFSTHPIQKAAETATIVMSRRNQNFTPREKALAERISAMDAAFRSWEKNG